MREVITVPAVTDSAVLACSAFAEGGSRQFCHVEHDAIGSVNVDRLRII